MMDEGREENRDRWQRMEEIYHAALPLATTERHAFVAQSCIGDAALQEEVTSLLVADAVVSDFLQEPIAEVGLAILADENLYDTEIVPQPTQPASVDLIGTKIDGRYEVIKWLDGGGFGDVYKAADTKIMSRAVVIKVLKHDVLRRASEERDRVMTKFKQEIEALARIKDPGVVSIYDTDTLPDGRPYIVMEFVDGPDLQQFINEARKKQIAEQGLDFQDVAEIVRQVGRTLTAAHEVKIIHRDLKPKNIMLSRNMSGDLQVKVIDFGIAKVRDSLIAPSTATGLSVAGTWPYMAPEQLSGKRVEAACDIYALGFIAYQMITGRVPFAATYPAQLKELQEAGVKIKPCDLNPNLPVDAQAAILKALEYYPDERHKRARDFGDELARALASAEELVRPLPPTNIDLEGKTIEDVRESERNESEEPVVAQSEPTAAPTSWLRSHRRWIYAVSASLLVGVMGLAVWRLYSRAESQPQREQQSATTPIVVPERTLIYWLSIQRPRDKEPFESTGNVVYDAGSKFWFNVQTTQDGALYLFGEGHDGDMISELNTVFPTPLSGKGDARIAAHTIKRVNENPNEFRNDSGVIYLWIIWAARPVPLLDEIVKNSYKTQGTIRDSSQQTDLRDFIKRYSEPQANITEDDLRSRVTLKGQSEILVDVRKLKYQP
jgi:serine/threonine protein kinase